MSVKIMGMVWDCQMPRDMKFILLAYADHADHDGNSIYPAVATIMKKTGYSERSVQSITRKLVEEKYLFEDGVSEYGTNKFRVNINKINGGANFAGGAKKSAKRANRGAKKSAEIAPDPSFNTSIIKPSNNITPNGVPPETKISDQQEMVGTLAKVSGFDLALNGARVGRTAKKLVKANYTPAFILEHYQPNGWWYQNDWRGLKGEMPTPEQIIETLGKIPRQESDQPAAKRTQKIQLPSGEIVEYEV